MKPAPIFIMLELQRNVTVLLDMIREDITTITDNEVTSLDDMLHFYTADIDFVRFVAGKILTDVYNDDVVVQLSDGIIDEANKIIDEINDQYMDYLNMSMVSFDLSATDHQRVVVILETGI